MNYLVLAIFIGLAAIGYSGQRKSSSSVEPTKIIVTQNPTPTPAVTVSPTPSATVTQKVVKTIQSGCNQASLDKFKKSSIALGYSESEVDSFIAIQKANNCRTISNKAANSQPPSQLTPTPTKKLSGYGTSSTYTQISDKVYGDDGTTYSQVGDAVMDNNSNTYRSSGSTFTYGSDGSSYIHSGNVTFGSNGSTCITTGIITNCSGTR